MHMDKLSKAVLKFAFTWKLVLSKVRVEWKLVVLCWGVCSTLVLRAPCREVLFAFVWVFLRLNPNFSPQFLAPGGSLDLQGGEGCSKSITTGDSGMGWGVSGCRGSGGRGEGRLAGAGFHSC